MWIRIAAMSLLSSGTFFWLCAATFLQANAPSQAEPTSVSDLRKTLFAKYDKLVRPVRNQKTTTTVSTSITPLFIRELNDETEILVLDSWVYMKWKDEYLVWDPEEYGGITAFNIPSTEVWRPDLKVYGGSPDEKLEFNVFTNTIINYTGDVMWVPPLTINSRCPLDHTSPNPDMQKCVVKIGSWTYNGYLLELQKYTEEVSLTDFRNNNPYWELLSITSEKEDKYYPCCKEPYPVITYNITMKRRALSSEKIVKATSLFAMLLTLAMFWLPPDSMQKLILGAFSELMLTMLVVFLGLSIKSPFVQLKATNSVYISMYAVAAAIFVEVLIINLARAMGPCRPPRFLVGITDGCCRMFCVCVSRPYPGGDMMESGSTSQKMKKRIPTAQEEWNLVAMAFDRILFVFGLLSFVAIHKFM